MGGLINLPRLQQLALGDQLFGISKGPRAFQREEEGIVGSGRRGQPAGRKPDLQTLRVDVDGGEPGVLQRGHSKSAAEGSSLNQPGKNPRSKTRRAPPLQPGKKLHLLQEPGEDDRNLRRRERRELIEAHVVSERHQMLAFRVEPHLESEGDPIRRGEPSVGFQITRSELDLQTLQVGEFVQGTGELTDNPLRID